MKHGKTGVQDNDNIGIDKYKAITTPYTMR